MWGGCMLSLPCLLNRFIGPFFTGVTMAAIASANDPASIVGLIGIAGLLGFVSLPVSERLIERVRDTML